MRQFITVVTALGLIATLLTVPASASARGGYPGAVSAADGGTLIVAYRKGTDGGHRVHSLKSGVQVIDVGHGKSEAAIAKLRANANVRYAEHQPDHGLLDLARRGGRR